MLKLDTSFKNSIVNLFEDFNYYVDIDARFLSFRKRDVQKIISFYVLFDYFYFLEHSSLRKIVRKLID